MADKVMAAVEAVYAAGLDESRWPAALAAIMQVVGGIAATLELFDRKPVNLREIRSYGLPSPMEISYMEEMAALNPRHAKLFNGKAGMVRSDYDILDEAAIDRDPFYQDFLAPVGFRYFAGGVLMADEKQSALLSVQRSIRQGHATRAELALIKLFLPHVRQAFDVAQRLKGLAEVNHSLQQVLDFLTDGVALATADGHVTYANESFQRILRERDGIGLRKGSIEFVVLEAQARFREALAGAARLRHGELAEWRYADFVAARLSEAPPYFVSIRPLQKFDTDKPAFSGAVMVFVRDLSHQRSATVLILRETFGLTVAEANLALAIQAGIELPDYAVAHAVSLNTVYTHLRRIKEKTNCSRLPQLIRKLGDLQFPLRSG